MKNVLKRIATVASVMALIVVTSICMTACGGDDTDKYATGVYAEYVSEGFYAYSDNGVGTIYYSDGNGNLKKITMEFVDDDEYVKHIKMDEGYRFITKIQRDYKYNPETKKVDIFNGYFCVDVAHNNHKLLSVEYTDNTKTQTKLLQDYLDANIVYKKISSLTEFAVSLNTDEGRVVDTSNLDDIADVWRDYFVQG